MTEKEQLEWCQRENAAVWFRKDKVTIKVSDFKHGVTGSSLSDAIAHIERVRQEGRVNAEGIASLRNREERG